MENSSDDIPDASTPGQDTVKDEEEKKRTARHQEARAAAAEASEDVKKHVAARARVATKSSKAAKAPKEKHDPIVNSDGLPAELYCLSCGEWRAVDRCERGVTSFVSSKNHTPMDRKTYTGICHECGKNIRAFYK